MVSAASVKPRWPLNTSTVTGRTSTVSSGFKQTQTQAWLSHIGSEDQTRVIDLGREWLSETSI